MLEGIITPNFKTYYMNYSKINMEKYNQEGMIEGIIYWKEGYRYYSWKRYLEVVGIVADILTLSYFGSNLGLLLLLLLLGIGPAIKFQIGFGYGHQVIRLKIP